MTDASANTVAADLTRRGKRSILIQPVDDQGRNFGTEVEVDFPVWCWVDSAGVRVYEGSADAWANLWPMQEHWISGFPAWYATPETTEGLKLLKELRPR